MIKNYKPENVAEELGEITQGQKLSKQAAKEFDVQQVPTAVKLLKRLKKAKTRAELWIIFKGARIHKFKRGHKYYGYHSLAINIKWRICFKWGQDKYPDNPDEHAYDVEINDHYGMGTAS